MPAGFFFHCVAKLLSFGLRIIRVRTRHLGLDTQLPGRLSESGSGGLPVRILDRHGDEVVLLDGIMAPAATRRESEHQAESGHLALLFHTYLLTRRQYIPLDKNFQRRGPTIPPQLLPRNRKTSSIIRMITTITSSTNARLW